MDVQQELAALRAEVNAWAASFPMPGFSESAL
jgi:hypothetical protein